MSQEEPRAIRPMDAHLGFGLRVAANHLTWSFTRRLQVAGVTPPEWVAMRLILDAGSLAPSHLARAMATTRGATTKLVDKLVRRGMIGRCAGPQDRRVQALFLTDAGRAFALSVADLAERNDEAFFAPLAPDERETLRDLLARLNDHANGAPPVPA